MPRYHFRMVSSHGIYEDPLGELHDDDARAVAMGQEIALALAQGRAGEDLAIEVYSECRVFLARLEGGVSRALDGMSVPLTTTGLSPAG